VILVNCNRIRVEDLEISSTTVGVELWETNNSEIVGNNITDSNNGIYLESSSFNTVTRCNVISTLDGIMLWRSSNFNTLSRNVLRSDQYLVGPYSTDGICLDHSFNNMISENELTDNLSPRISLDNHSSNNTIQRNNVHGSSGSGIGLDGYSSYNCLAGNDIGTADEGVKLVGNSNHNIISDNHINCAENGVEIIGSLCNNIFGNNLRGSDAGILLSDPMLKSDISVYNIISGNNITGSYRYGDIFIYESSHNSIWHNNFAHNKEQVHTENAVNVWNDGYPSGGNYWSGYNGTDSDYDGIGDTPYFIDENNQDNYPLMGMFHSFNTSYGYAVSFISNSSISEFSFNLSSIEAYPPEAILAFNVSGDSDTDGFLRVCIPKILINGSYVIMFDGEIITNITYPQVRELPCSNETYEYLYINYTHSEHTILITGTTTIPEFPSFLILPLFMTTTLLAVMVYKRKRST